MPDTKPFYQSTTYWSLFVVLFSTVSQILQPWGLEVPTMVGDFVNNQFVDVATQVGVFVGIAGAAWGRKKATKGITIK